MLLEKDVRKPVDNSLAVSFFLWNIHESTVFKTDKKY